MFLFLTLNKFAPLFPFYGYFVGRKYFYLVFTICSYTFQQDMTLVVEDKEIALCAIMIWQKLEDFPEDTIGSLNGWMSLYVAVESV